ncbi:MAG: phosphoglycerate kinase [Anaerolineae bacterium]|nr:phosphoglycerate kinase [Anaerolineae bacterium]NUQ02548.1 phosphoglycerate kinase [Anaerolineae bacterium]
MNKMTIRDIDLRGKRVLVRVDFNVPLDGGVITDNTRIRAAVPTLQHILAQGPRYIALMSHLGRPKDGPDPKFSLRPVANALAGLLGRDVAFAEDCVGEAARRAAEALPNGGVLLLENTRYYKGEEKNDPSLSAQMAELGDIFVMDAFGSAHRAHSSTVGVTEHLPSVAGFLMEKEINYLASAIENPKRPFVAILGGAKVSDKIAVIESLLAKCDRLLIGGGMANTFFKAQGYSTGNSLVEADAVETARHLLAKSGGKLILPVDGVLGDKFADDAQTQVIAVSAGVPEGWAIYDIGPETIRQFAQELASAQTVVWNGPMGVFEKDPFAAGTREVAQLLAKRTTEGAVTIIGGGDSVAAVEEAGLADKVSHVSTGGGASLEMLEGKTLPGVAALRDR